MNLKNLFSIPFNRSWNEYKNPFYVWWKCRKYYKFPYIHFYCGKLTWFFGMPISKYKYNKIFDFTTSALGWKWGFYYPSYSYDPYIVFTFFRKWQIMWIFNYMYKNDELSSIKNIATWNAMLNMLYNKNIH